MAISVSLSCFSRRFTVLRSAAFSLRRTSGTAELVRLAAGTSSCLPASITPRRNQARSIQVAADQRLACAGCRRCSHSVKWLTFSGWPLSTYLHRQDQWMVLYKRRRASRLQNTHECQAAAAYCPLLSWHSLMKKTQSTMDFLQIYLGTLCLFLAVITLHVFACSPSPTNVPVEPPDHRPCALILPCMLRTQLSLP